MNPGELKHLIEIQDPAQSGSGTTYTTARKQWAHVEPLSAAKITTLAAQGSKVTHTVLLRRKPEVNIGQRFLWDGRIFKFTLVQKFIERQEATAEELNP